MDIEFFSSMYITQYWYDFYIYSQAVPILTDVTSRKWWNRKFTIYNGFKEKNYNI